MQTQDQIHHSSGLAAIYHTAVGLKKVTENRQTENRESNYRGHSNPVDRQVERAYIQYLLEDDAVVL